MHQRPDDQLSRVSAPLRLGVALSLLLVLVLTLASPQPALADHEGGDDALVGMGVGLIVASSASVVTMFVGLGFNAVAEAHVNAEEGMSDDLSETSYELGIANIILGSIGAVGAMVLWGVSGEVHYAIPAVVALGQVGIGAWGINVSSRDHEADIMISPVMIPDAENGLSPGAAITISHF